MQAGGTCASIFLSSGADVKSPVQVCNVLLHLLQPHQVADLVQPMLYVVRQVSLLCGHAAHQPLQRMERICLWGGREVNLSGTSA